MELLITPVIMVINNTFYWVEINAPFKFGYGRSGNTIHSGGKVELINITHVFDCRAIVHLDIGGVKATKLC